MVTYGVVSHSLALVHTCNPSIILHYGITRSQLVSEWATALKPDWGSCQGLWVCSSQQLEWLLLAGLLSLIDLPCPDFDCLLPTLGVLSLCLQSLWRQQLEMMVEDRGPDSSNQHRPAAANQVTSRIISQNNYSTVSISHNYDTMAVYSVNCV